MGRGQGRVLRESQRKHIKITGGGGQVTGSPGSGCPASFPRGACCFALPHSLLQPELSQDPQPSFL